MTTFKVAYCWQTEPEWNHGEFLVEAETREEAESEFWDNDTSWRHNVEVIDVDKMED